MPIVSMPDGTRVRFPDDMSKDEIRAIIKRKFPEADPEIGGKAYQIARGAVQGAVYDPIEGIGQIIEHATGKKIPIPQSVRNWFDKVRENTEATGTGTASRIGGAVASALVAPELVIGQVGRAGAAAGALAREAGAARTLAPSLGELRVAATSRAGEKAAELLPKYEEYARRAGKSAMDLTAEERTAARLGQMPPGPPSRLGAFAKRAGVGAGVGAVQPVDPEAEDFAGQKAFQALAGGTLGSLAGVPVGGPILRHIGRHRYHYGPASVLGAVMHPATALPSLALLSGLAAQYGLEKAGPMAAGPLGAIAGQAASGKPREEAPDAESQ